MPFQRPTLPELIERAASDVESRLPGVDARLRRNAAAVLAIVQANGLNGIYGYLDFLSKNFLPDLAEDEILLRIAAIWGVAQKAATPAKGAATVSGNDGKPVLATTVLRRSDGALFTVDADVVIAGGTATVALTASTPGAAGNTAAGSQLQFTQPISGVQNVATVAVGGLAGGADVESMDSLRQRLLERIQAPPQGGASADYQAWALAVAEVTRVWVYPEWQGLGTVGITFVMDGRANRIPLAGDVTAVQAAIDAARPVTAEVFVFAPTAVPLNVQIHLNAGDTAAIRTAIAVALADLVAREAVPGGTLYLSHINQAISNAAGEVDHALIAPVADVAVPAGSITTLGAVTWS